ncbi:hypothetical protein ACQ4PT_060958 [Festuca glaucescens]
MAAATLLPRLSAAVALALLVAAVPSAEAYDPLDPNGNITIKWDIMEWTSDGYTAVVSIYNYQKYRHIQAPGWHLGWVWAKKEIIWSMLGGQAVEQGDCSHFKGNIPHCCKTNPVTVDLLPGVPFNVQVANCCKGGVLSSWVQDPVSAVASFQITVGRSGTSNKTVKAPRNFTLKAPGPGYTCGVAQTLKPPTKFISPDGRRTTQAHDDTAMLWGVKYYNDLLMVAGPEGNVQSELLFRKDPSSFTFGKGWAFPRRIYFNGESCVMPPPDSYPVLPGSSPRLKKTTFLILSVAFCAMVAFLHNHFVLDKYCGKS